MAETLVSSVTLELPLWSLSSYPWLVFYPFDDELDEGDDDGD